MGVYLITLFRGCTATGDIAGSCLQGCGQSGSAPSLPAWGAKYRHLNTQSVEARTRNTLAPLHSCAEALPSITSRRRAPIVDVQVIQKRLDFVYTAMSLTTDRLTEPTTDFFKEGPTTNREHAFMRTKSTVYTVLFCPACVRNVVFKGPGTFMDVGRPTFEGTAMAMLFFVCCRTCREIKSIEDEDLRMTMVMRMSVDSEAIKEIGKCVPAKMKVFGSTPGSGIRQTDMGEAAIMDRNVITDIIRDHCELLSAIGGMLVSPLPDFV
jgi:hypothetical protein